VKIVFRSYLRQKWIDLRQTKKNDQRIILHISQSTFHQRKRFVFDICLKYPGERPVAAATWMSTYIHCVQKKNTNSYFLSYLHDWCVDL